MLWKALTSVLVVSCLWSACADAAAQAACARVFGAQSAVCRASGVADDWRLLETEGVPAHALAAAVEPCAKRRGDAGAGYACAREALWRAARDNAVEDDAEPPPLTGRYLARARGLYGELTILERRNGALRVALRSERAPPGHVCRLEIANAWRTGLGLAWKGEVVPGEPASTCDLSVRPTGDGLLVESDTRCSWACGTQGAYEGAYRLAR